MKKYGLQLRIPPQQQQQKKPAATKPALPPAALGFGDDDDDDVEKEIARQAAKNRLLKEVEEKHKKALEEDPSAFDYDGVYDEMKLKIAKPIRQDQTERKPKYIEQLLEKAKERKMQQDIVYEKKLVKERNKEDHLFEDKEKFVTSSYKKKLEEQAKWKEEDRLRQLREEKEDSRSVTDFYFNLNRNVALGAQQADIKKPKQQETTIEKDMKREPPPEAKVPSASRSTGGREDVDPGASSCSENTIKPLDSLSNSKSSITSDGEKTESEEASEHKIEESYKRSQDAVAAARERYLARKRAREQ